MQPRQNQTEVEALRAELDKAADFGQAIPSEAELESESQISGWATPSETESAFGSWIRRCA
jgi:hypothetical protein